MYPQFMDTREQGKETERWDLGILCVQRTESWRFQHFTRIQYGIQWDSTEVPQGHRENKSSKSWMTMTLYWSSLKPMGIISIKTPWPVRTILPVWGHWMSLRGCDLCIWNMWGVIMGWPQFMRWGSFCNLSWNRCGVNPCGGFIKWGYPQIPKSFVLVGISFINHQFGVPPF